MTNSMDIRNLMLPHVLEATPYAGVEPPDVLAREAGIPEDQVVKLDGNENLYGPAPGVAEALAAYDGYHIYPDPMQRRVRETLAAYAGTTPDRVVAGVGSDELIDLLLRLFVGPGESVIQCFPTFGMYAAFTQLIGGKLVSVPRDETFDVPVDAVRQAATDGAKILFLASPNNPTGNLVDEATVRQLLALGIVVVVDEAYYEFSGATLVHLVPENPNLVVLRTFSKWAGLAGMRLGYGIMDTLVAERMMTIKPPYNITVASETALLASLEELDLLMSRVKAIVQERDELFQRLQAIEGVVPVPSRANFILCRLPEGQGNRVYGELARRGVFVRYYDAPPLQDCIRVSVALPYHSQRLVDALIEILS